MPIFEIGGCYEYKLNTVGGINYVMSINSLIKHHARQTNKTLTNILLSCDPSDETIELIKSFERVNRSLDLSRKALDDYTNLLLEVQSQLKHNRIQPSTDDKILKIQSENILCSNEQNKTINPHHENDNFINTSLLNRILGDNSNQSQSNTKINFIDDPDLYDVVARIKEKNKQANQNNIKSTKTKFYYRKPRYKKDLSKMLDLFKWAEENQMKNNDKITTLFDVSKNQQPNIKPTVTAPKTENENKSNNSFCCVDSLLDFLNKTIPNQEKSNLKHQKYKSLSYDEVNKFICSNDAFNNFKKNNTNTVKNLTADEKLIKSVLNSDNDYFNFINPVIKWMEYRRNNSNPYNFKNDVIALFEFVKTISKNNPVLANFVVDRSIANGWKNLVENQNINNVVDDFDSSDKNSLKIPTFKDLLTDFKNIYIKYKQLPDHLTTQSRFTIKSLEITSLKIKDLFELYQKLSKFKNISTNTAVKHFNYLESWQMLNNNSKICFCGVHKLFGYVPCSFNDVSVIKKFNNLLIHYNPSQIINALIGLKLYNVKHVQFDLILWAMYHFNPHSGGIPPKYLNIIDDIELFLTINNIKIYKNKINSAEVIKNNMIKFALSNKDELQKLNMFSFLMFEKERSSFILDKIRKNINSQKIIYTDDDLNIFEQYHSGKLNSFIRILNKFNPDNFYFYEQKINK